MDCIECGEESNYHRAVVELVTGTVLGSYCVDCEDRRFGDELDTHTANDRCVCCDRLGHYLLPVHYIDVDLTDREAPAETGWIDRSAPRLCFDHLFELTTPTDLVRRRRQGVAWMRR